MHMLKERTKDDKYAVSLCGVIWPEGTNDKTKVDCPGCMKLMG